MHIGTHQWKYCGGIFEKEGQGESPQSFFLEQCRIETDLIKGKKVAPITSAKTISWSDDFIQLNIFKESPWSQQINKLLLIWST